MWIVPKNISIPSQYVQGFSESSEDLKELSQIYEQSAFWRSKPLSLKTWLQKWKRVYWIQLLFGRTLKHSQHTSFETLLISYLRDIPVSHFRMQVKEKEQMIPDTSGHTSSEQLTLFDLPCVCSKMSEATSLSDSEKSLLRWKEWVIKSTGEYSVRRKLARAIREKEYSSWQSEKTVWSTPVATDLNRTTKYQQGGTALSLQVNWPTPTTQENEHDKEKLLARQKRLKARNNGENGTKYSGNGCGPNLATVVSDKWVSNWGTPTTRDYKDGTAKSMENVPTNGLLGRMVHSPENTLPDLDSHNMLGKSLEQVDIPTAYQVLYDQCGVQAGRILRKCWERKYGKKLTLESKLTLNPKWVCHLMNITFAKTFFVHLEIPSTKIPPN